MTRICTLALSLMMLSPTACVRRALAPTFAKAYKNVMAAQLQSRPSRPLTPYRGDEAKRIIRAYYGSLAPADSGGGAESSSSSSSVSSGQTPPAPSNNANPFAFKTR